MKRFKRYIIEQEAQHNVPKPTSTQVGDHHWQNPGHGEEHDEVDTQHKALKNDPHTPDHVKKQLAHLRNKSNYVSAMKNATTTNIHHTDNDVHKIGNSDVADKRGVVGHPDIESEKSKRVSDQFKKSKETGKPMTKPIILHDTHTNHKHLLAGNTRLTHGVQDHKTTVPAHTIEYDSSKQ